MFIMAIILNLWLKKYKLNKQRFTTCTLMLSLFNVSQIRQSWLKKLTESYVVSAQQTYSYCIPMCKKLWKIDVM